MQRIVKIKEIIEEYVVQDGKEYLIKLNYASKEHNAFNSQERIPLATNLTYEELDKANRKEKQELIAALVTEK
ncbi:hypothetical protein [endosymbiont GvMRE of Glomus versiforme]|uniref:hypothetical protein n=1 Tax=endosymbiont GvMRE of Glomus versiforme TaxID=2039283 RepID=UPI000ECB1A17|nr:hypothetical protein [endosymbiont GvMRE of Glomus versiforme]RHZ37147.1 hypothetical protein GvMRE_I1g494 [endosymbiont GvMRE of Glomus versiforme]